MGFFLSQQIDGSKGVKKEEGNKVENQGVFSFLRAGSLGLAVEVTVSLGPGGEKVPLWEQMGKSICSQQRDQQTGTWSHSRWAGLEH